MNFQIREHSVLVHLFGFSFISHGSVLWSLLYKSRIPFVRFVPKHFLFFGAIVGDTFEKFNLQLVIADVQK